MILDLYVNLSVEEQSILIINKFVQAANQDNLYKYGQAVHHNNWYIVDKQSTGDNLYEYGPL